MSGLVVEIEVHVTSAWEVRSEPGEMCYVFSTTLCLGLTLDSLFETRSHYAP